MSIKKKLFSILLLSSLMLGCGFSEESTVKKYLPGTYTRNHKTGDDIILGYYKELKIQKLSSNEYRISCIKNDELDRNGKILEIYTPDIFDIEISSISPIQKSDSIKEYYINSFVTNIIQDGTTFSDADSGVNSKNIIKLLVEKDTVEVKVVRKFLSSIKKKIAFKRKKDDKKFCKG